jgi:hypothetical protein
MWRRNGNFIFQRRNPAIFELRLKTMCKLEKTKTIIEETLQIAINKIL